MRFFKSCPTYKQTRAHEMLFRLVMVFGFITQPIPGWPRGERPLQKKPPENSEPEANP